MYLSFDSISLVKPNTSRPANSERYLVCKWKNENTYNIFEYLQECHEKMWSWSNDSDNNLNDIVEIVPMELITNPQSDFFKYIWHSNNENGNRQIQNLRKIHAFFRDESLFEHRQREVRENCLNHWGIPMFNNMTNLRLIDQFTDDLPTFGEGIELRRSNIETALISPLTWTFTILEGKRNKRNTGFYIGMGRCQVKRLEGNLWKNIYEKFELSKDTLVYGEIVYELKGQVPNQQKTPSFHIIDGFILGGKDITKECFTKRHELCTMFAKAMNKVTSGFASVRTKPFFRLDSVKEVAKCFRFQTVKGEGKREKRVCPIDYKDENSALFQPACILLLNVSEVSPPWVIKISQSRNQEYWFNTKNGTSTYEIPSFAVRDSNHAIRTRINWWLDEYTRLDSPLIPENGSQPNDQSDRLHLHDFYHHIKTNLEL